MGLLTPVSTVDVPIFLVVTLEKGMCALVYTSLLDLFQIAKPYLGRVRLAISPNVVRYSVVAAVEEMVLSA